MFRMLIRGLAVSLPPVLTIVIALWVGNFLNTYIIQPATISVKYVISLVVDESVSVNSLTHIEGAPPLPHSEGSYLVTQRVANQFEQRFSTVVERATDNEEWAVKQERRIAWVVSETESVPPSVFVPLGPLAVPYDVYAVVARNMPPGQIPGSARGVYMEYVAHKYFGSTFFLSLLTVCLIVVLIYIVGRFVSVRIGNWIVTQFEMRVLGRLPVIRNVYGSVKQVTDFLFSENQQVSYRGVAAVEYPRKGIYTVGFVTGESMREIAEHDNEPFVSVLIPTSPMPMTGFTINVRRSEIIALNLTVEQAMQFCISCGVLTPPHQKMTPAAIDSLVQSRSKRDAEKFDNDHVDNG